MIACCSMLPSYNQKGGSHCCCCSFRFLRRQSVGINIISDISTTSICRAGGNLVTSAAACCVTGPAVQNFIETRFASASIALQKLEQSVTTMTDESKRQHDDVMAALKNVRVYRQTLDQEQLTA